MNPKAISETARIAAMETAHPSGDPRFADLDRTIESYNREPTALIQVLHAAQQMFGYLSADVLHYIAIALKLPPSHVYGVVTFYHFFTLVPRGKHQIMVCRGTGCHVRGSQAIISALEKELGIKEGETTKDGLFSLTTARCIGACALAPALSVGDDVYGKLTADKVPHLCKVDLKNMFEELSQHILDIAMNSLSANAKKVQINILESRKHDWLVLRVRDDGRGMDAATLKRVLAKRWSSKPTRRKPVGLGLALLQQTSEMCGGHFHVRSAPGKGTSVTASMRLSHIDRPPLGDLNATILALCATDKKMDVQLNYRSDEQKFSFDSQEPTVRGEVIL